MYSGPPNGYVCRICNIPGHWIQQCPMKNRSNQTQIPYNYRCKICGKSDHLIYQCPLKYHPTISRVPTNYVCHICGIPGHWIQNCPQRMIPHSFVKEKGASPIFEKLTDRFSRSLFIVKAYMNDNGLREYLLDLIKIITTFYNQSDVFYSKWKGPHMKIIEGTKVYKEIAGDHDRDPNYNQLRKFESIFGTEVISKGVYEWKIRVNKLNYQDGYYNLYVGVINTKICEMSSVFPGNTGYAGCYRFEVFNLCRPKVTKQGDVVKLILDMPKESLSCEINGICIGRMRGGANGEYRLMLSLYFAENELELL